MFNLQNNFLKLFAFLSISAFAQLKPIKEVFEPTQTFDPETHGKVAVVQWAPFADTPLGVTKEKAEAYKQENREQLEAYIREAAAKGAELVLTPEFAIVGYPDIPELPSEEDEFRNREDIEPYVETAPGPSTKYFSKLAKELKVAIHIGFAEVEKASDRYFNTVVAIDASGKIVAKYRKINLYEGENQFLSPGTEPVVYEGPFGKVGMAICADIYSSVPMKSYASKKVNMVALSTSWAQWNSGMDNFKRAARSGSFFVLASNQRYFPDSGVINPDGTTQSHIRQSNGLAYGFLPYKK